MKTKVILIILLILSSFVLVSAVTSTTSQISITILNQDPDPVQQGDVVEIQITPDSFVHEYLCHKGDTTEGNIRMNNSHFIHITIKTIDSSMTIIT